MTCAVRTNVYFTCIQVHRLFTIDTQNIYNNMNSEHCEL